MTPMQKSSEGDPSVAPENGQAESSLQQYTDTRSIGRKALWILGLGLGGFLVWAVFAPLDEGVPSQGVVAIDTKRKTVQHLTGGILKDVLVREGDSVQEGQVLMRLDEAASRANFESIRQRYLGLSAMKSRLVAEQSGHGRIVFDEDVVSAARQDPYIRQQVLNQERLFETRKQALSTDLQGMQEAIEGLRAQLQSGRQMQVQRQRQLSLLQEELQNIQSLVKDGYAPRNRQLEIERAVADVQASLADLQGSEQRAQRSMAELDLRMSSRRHEYRKEVESQLADIAREVLADAEKYTAQKADLERIEIRSPAAGQVVGLAVQTAGAVVQSGQRLLDVVPDVQQLVLEARIAPHLIDKVQAGLHADIRFNAFAHSPQLVVDGRVISISGDLLTDPASPQMPYFLARLEVTPEGMKKLGKRQMQPGMPAEVVIRTGERSMLAYLLHPLTKRLARSMKEE